MTGAFRAPPPPPFVKAMPIGNELVPAPIFARTMAAIVDLAIVTLLVTAVLMVVTLVAMLVFGTLFGETIAAMQEQGPSFGQLTLAGIFVVGVVLAIAGVMHGYYIYYEFKKGATPGKRIFDLRVVSITGDPITRGQAVYRDMIRWYIDVMFVVPAIVGILMTKRRQRVGDILAKTMVISSKGLGPVLPARSMYLPLTEYHELLTALEPSPVSDELAQEYLRFAHPAFMLGRIGTMQAERLRWISNVRAKLMESEAFTDDQVLRFFAEHCFQRVNRKRPANG